MKNHISASWLHKIVYPKQKLENCYSISHQRKRFAKSVYIQSITCTPQEKWFIYLRLINLDRSNMCMFILKYSCIVI